MRPWLDPVRWALDCVPSPVTLFVRDDDVGWSDERLYRLLNITQYLKVPIDLAAIPDAVGPTLARELRHAMGHAESVVSAHQHGFAHVNHEPAGGKAEFGPSRSVAEQRHDIAAGRAKLQDRLGVALPPIFTPPWNACTTTTAAALVELGFQLLSRDAGAPALAAAGLEELPVHLDWAGGRGAGRGADPWGETIASCIAGADGPLGLKLHHAAMGGDDRKLLSELLAVFTTHENMRVRSMTECARRPTSTA
jgi:hypothetical protein